LAALVNRWHKLKEFRNGYADNRLELRCSRIMEALAVDHFGEILVGIVLLVFGMSFRGWSTAIKETSSKILEKLEALSVEFHEHRVKTENRVTSVETKIDSLMGRDK
jgi:hypothetical protein